MSVTHEWCEVSLMTDCIQALNILDMLFHAERQRAQGIISFCSTPTGTRDEGHAGSGVVEVWDFPLGSC